VSYLVKDIAGIKTPSMLTLVNPGWMAVLAWQAGSASGSFLTGTIIQGLISVRNPEYIPEPWQGTLFVYAMVVVIYIFNVYAASWMPRIQNVLLILHIVCWVIVVVVLWAMAPHQSAHAVFLEFNNGGGWPTIGVSLMIGQISAIYGSLSRSPSFSFHRFWLR
jgi:amino acid transporter